MTTLEEMRARQQPLTTRFGYRTDAQTVLADHDLTGRTAVVTGGYSGLGLETVKALADAGASVIVPARRPDVAAAAVAGVPRTQVAAMDLSDLESVAAFTRTVRESGETIDLLINAAGVMATPAKLTAQRWEFQFGTNHLGHFALTAGLAPLLADGARVVSYSSVAHFYSTVRFDDVNFAADEYDPLLAYGQSKTANALFAVALDARAASRGINAYSVHPGGIMTELQRNMPREELIRRQWIDEDGTPNPLFKTPSQGAATALWAATASELVDRGGVYCEDCGIKAVVPSDHEDVVAGGVKQWAIDPDAAERLWEVSTRATGLDIFGA